MDIRESPALTWQREDKCTQPRLFGEVGTLSCTAKDEKDEKRNSGIYFRDSYLTKKKQKTGM